MTGWHLLPRRYRTWYVVQHVNELMHSNKYFQYFCYSRCRFSGERGPPASWFTPEQRLRPPKASKPHLKPHLHSDCLTFLKCRVIPALTSVPSLTRLWEELVHENNQDQLFRKYRSLQALHSPEQKQQLCATVHQAMTQAAKMYIRRTSLVCQL